MEMRPSGAHGSGGASDPGPALNRSGCTKTCPARCGAGPASAYKAPGAHEHPPLAQLTLKSSCLVSPLPDPLPLYPAACAVAGRKGALYVVEKDDFPPSRASGHAAAAPKARASSKLGEKEGKLEDWKALKSTGRLES